jgi:hypothetical protein
MNKRTADILLTTLLIILPMLVGCTLIGLAAGSAAKKRKETMPGWEIVSLSKGRRVTLSMMDGSVIHGKYQGIVRDDLEGYSARYQSWLAARTSPVFMPEFRASVTLVSLSGEAVEGTFYGFDQGYVYVAAKRRSSRWNLAQVSSIADSLGNVVTGTMLINEIVSGDVPLWNRYMIDSQYHNDDLSVEPRDIETVVAYGNNATAVGFVIGAAIDAAIVIAIANSDWDSGGSSSTSTSSFGSSSGSCPFIFSFDGEHYQFDAEPLGGSFFESLSRPDFARLNQIRPVDGQYRIRVATELRESDYVDQLRLHVIDHEPESEVVPTAFGQFAVITEPIDPLSATDFDGRNVREHVRSRDGHRWISNPFGRNLDDPKQLRDGLVLEFDRPPDAQEATLAVTVKNLEWTDQIAGDVFQLQGEELDSWYRQLNTEPERTEAFQRAVVREALLWMDIWDGNDWRPSGPIIAMSPRIVSDRAVEIMLPEDLEGPLRIRLSAMAGMWAIDRISVDYTPGTALQVSTIDPAEATDYRGHDVLESLSATDRNYHVTSKIGEYADVVFDAPDALATGERTVVLEATGYYEIHIDATGAADHELTERLIHEPGALSRWALSNLYAQTNAALASLDNQ